MTHHHPLAELLMAPLMGAAFCLFLPLLGWTLLFVPVFRYARRHIR